MDSQKALQEAFNQSLIANYGHDYAKQNTPAVSESENNLAAINAQTDDAKDEAAISKLPPDQQQFVRDNKGIGGALRVGAESFGNQALFGLPEMAYDKFADPNDVAEHNALKDYHSTANIVGGAGGALTSLAIGGPLFDAAGAAGHLGEAAVVGGREAEQLSLARTIASKIVGGAAEGAVVGAPQTVGNAILGDPKEAAENLVFSAGIGGLLGPAAFGLKKGIETGGELASNLNSGVNTELKSYIKDPDSLLSVFGDVNKSSLKGAELTEAGKEKLDNLITSSVKKGLKVGGLAAGGPLGYFKGELAGSLAEQVVSMIPDSAKTAALQATLKASDLAQTQLNRIPGILEGLTKSSFGKALSNSGNVFAEAGKDIASAKDDYESFKQLSDKLAADQASNKTVDTVSNNSVGIKNSDIQQAYQQTSLGAVQYLNSVIPKNPNPPKMFSDNNTWKPTASQLTAFKSQMEVVNNPYKILDKLQDGTVTTQDINAVKTVYPAIYSKITDEILKHATDNKYSNLSFAAKSKLSLMTGVPIESSFEPASINALQANFAQGNQQQKPNTSNKPLGNSNDFLTDNQKISYGMSNS